MPAERILLIRTGGLGDTLLLWPAVCALRRRYPDACIEVMGRIERCELLVAPGGADRAVDIEGSGYHHLLGSADLVPAEVRARFGQYQLIVAFALPGDFCLAENLSACGAGEVHAFLPYPRPGERVHVAEHCLRALAECDLVLPGEDLLLPVSEAGHLGGARRLRSLGLPGAGLFVVAPGSGSRAKNWPAEGFVRMIAWGRVRGLVPLLIEGPADRESVEEVLGGLPSGSDPPTVLRDDSPLKVRDAIAGAALFVGNDSGLAHLSGFLGVPTVAIFGPTDPVWWRPLGPAVRVVRSESTCSPCSSDAMQSCPRRMCLEDVSAVQAIAAAEGLLDGRETGYV